MTIFAIMKEGRFDIDNHIRELPSVQKAIHDRMIRNVRLHRIVDEALEHDSQTARYWARWKFKFNHWHRTNSGRTNPTPALPEAIALTNKGERNPRRAVWVGTTLYDCIDSASIATGKPPKTLRNAVRSKYRRTKLNGEWVPVRFADEKEE